MDTLAKRLAGLSPEHRAVIVLRYLLGYTPGELAEQLDLPRGTVNSRLRRGLDDLKGRLSKILRRRIDLIEEPSHSPRVQAEIDRDRVLAF